MYNLLASFQLSRKDIDVLVDFRGRRYYITEWKAEVVLNRLVVAMTAAKGRKELGYAWFWEESLRWVCGSRACFELAAMESVAVLLFGFYEMFASCFVLLQGTLQDHLAASLSPIRAVVLMGRIEIETSRRNETFPERAPKQTFKTFHILI